MRKEVVGFVQAVLGNNKCVSQFGNGQKREISAYSLSYICDKGEVGKEVDENISDFSKYNKVNF